MANNIFVYWSDDLGAGHLTIIVGTGGRAFIKKYCPQGRVFDKFFKCPGFARGFARGMLAAGIDSQLNKNRK